MFVTMFFYRFQEIDINYNSYVYGESDDDGEMSSRKRKKNDRVLGGS